LGLRISDLDELDEGMVWDMIIEAKNDDYEYPYEATQEDFAAFSRL